MGQQTSELAILPAGNGLAMQAGQSASTTSLNTHIEATQEPAPPFHLVSDYVYVYALLHGLGLLTGTDRSVLI